jgi:effector-binding domain-containing protein
MFSRICIKLYKKGRKHRNSDKSYVIRYVKYNKHKDLDNYYREKLMLYVPYRVDENIFKKIYSTWEHAYNSLIETIKENEQILCMKQI